MRQDKVILAIGGFPPEAFKHLRDLLPRIRGRFLAPTLRSYPPPGLGGEIWGTRLLAGIGDIKLQLRTY
jgi:hypothetical protein